MPELVRAVRFDAADGVQLQVNSRSILIDAEKGTVSPTATMKLRSAAGTVHQVVNIMGRVRSCTPDAAYPGLRAC